MRLLVMLLIVVTYPVYAEEFDFWTMSSVQSCAVRYYDSADEACACGVPLHNSSMSSGHGSGTGGAYEHCYGVRTDGTNDNAWIGISTIHHTISCGVDEEYDSELMACVAVAGDCGFGRAWDWSLNGGAGGCVDIPTDCPEGSIEYNGKCMPIVECQDGYNVEDPGGIPCIPPPLEPLPAGCGTVNGEQWCPDPNHENCGWLNNIWMCNDRPSTNCGWVNGKWLCVDVDPLIYDPLDLPEGCAQRSDGSIICLRPDRDDDGNIIQEDTIQDEYIDTEIDTSGSTTITTTVIDNGDGTTTTTSVSTGEETKSQKGGGSVSEVGCKQFRCDGDPIQCYQAKKLWEQKCLIEFDESKLDQTNYMPEEEIVDIGDLDHDDMMPGGSCPSDIPIAAFGQTIIIPIYKFCDTFELMGVLVLMASALVSLRILTA